MRAGFEVYNLSVTRPACMMAQGLEWDTCCKRDIRGELLWWSAYMTVAGRIAMDLDPGLQPSPGPFQPSLL